MPTDPTNLQLHWAFNGDQAKAGIASCGQLHSPATTNPVRVSCRRCWRVVSLRDAAHRHPLKRCPSCGVEYTFDAWGRLGLRYRLVEVLVLFDGIQSTEFFEERVCPCGVPLQVKCDDLEALRKGLEVG